MKKMWVNFLILFSLLSPGSSWASLFSSDVKATFAAAKKENKPILIDFFGIWCPPCNELDETVFESTLFLEKSKAFKLLKVDADARASWKIKDKYKVGGYPTIVFTDPGGVEIYRIVGYRNLKEFIRIMDLVLASKKNMSQSCSSKDPEDTWRCAVICSERKDIECAAAAFNKLQEVLKPGSARYDWIRTYALESIELPDLKRTGYESLLQEYNTTPQALVWASSYLSLFDDDKDLKPKKELLEKVLSHYPEMTQDARLEELGLNKMALTQIKAEILEKIGKLDEAKVTWKEASILLEKAAAELTKGAHVRGFTLDRIGCLEQAGEFEAALKLASEYRAFYPDEFTFHFVAGNLLERMKRYAEAIPIVKKGYEVSYGDNRIRVAILLVRLYATVPNRAAAKKIVDEVTAQIKPDKTLHVRTPRYLKRLNEAWEKFPTG